jgi:hypothetical protein
METARPLLKDTGGGGGKGGGMEGPVTTVSTGALSSASKYSSRSGRPHLWQNRASSGGYAPHVHRSVTSLV